MQLNELNTINKGVILNPKVDLTVFSKFVAFYIW
jgi:hypothetical protein